MTDVPTRLPLLQQARNIIERYATQDSGSNSLDEFLLPVLSNQKMNAYLKEVADIRQTQHYAKIVDVKVSKDMDLLEKSLRK